MDLASKNNGVHHLPTEMLMAIFKLLMDPVDTSSLPWFNALGRRYGPETVASVCRRWRRIAFDTRCIWSHLYISDAWKKEKVISYWQEMSRRSARTAINVTVVDLNIPNVDEDLPSVFVDLLNTVTQLGHLRIIIGDTKAVRWISPLFEGVGVKPTSLTVQTPWSPSTDLYFGVDSPSSIEFWGGLMLPFDQIFADARSSQLMEVTLDGVIVHMGSTAISNLPQMNHLRRLWIKQPPEHEMAPFVMEDFFSLPKLEELYLYVTFDENWTISGDPVAPVAPLRSFYLSQYYPIKFNFETSPPVFPKLTSFGVENVEREDLLAFFSANPTIVNFTLPTETVLRPEDWNTHHFRSLELPWGFDVDPLLQHPLILPKIARLRLTYDPEQASKYAPLVEMQCRVEERPRVPLLTVEVESDDVESAHGVLSQIAEVAMDSWRKEDGRLWHFFFDKTYSS